jgi:transcriptional regulator
MYIPPHFKIQDESKLHAFIRQHSFATLITQDGAAPFASHLPMLLETDSGKQGMLVSHMARANPQWQHFSESAGEALAIFHGPHAFISPTWYETQPAVPTWNYAAVHVYGRPRIIDDHERVVSLLEATVRTYESGEVTALPVEYRDKMVRGIVAFEMEITRIEGKFKLGQNRSEADSLGVIQALSKSSDQDDLAVAALMQQECLVLE